MTSATIKLSLPRGDAKSLRTAEISNWTGKAVAAPRTELDELLAREELDKAGVYVLIGSDPLTNSPRAHIGEAEIIRDRLKQHTTKEFWVSAIVFVSKDENLTKAHVRYLESRLLAETALVNRFKLEQNQAGGSKLPESDREDMEVFLSRARQILPVLAPTSSRRSLNWPRNLSPAVCSSIASREPRRAVSAPRTASSYSAAPPPSWSSGPPAAHLLGSERGYGRRIARHYLYHRQAREIGRECLLQGYGFQVRLHRIAGRFEREFQALDIGRDVGILDGWETAVAAGRLQTRAAELRGNVFGGDVETGRWRGPPPAAGRRPGGKRRPSDRWASGEWRSAGWRGRFAPRRERLAGRHPQWQQASQS
ncbi:MAG: GIY-YIG nuclease family protein [Bryobacteraceae bacterium]